MGRTTRQCHEGLAEACRETALPYRIVARWVRAFTEGCESVAQLGRPSVSDEQVQAVAMLLTHRSTSNNMRVRPRDRIIT